MPTKQNNDILKPSTPDALILEAWSQGFMIGSLIIMAAIAVSNMRRGVLLHKLILIEVRTPFAKSTSFDRPLTHRF